MKHMLMLSRCDCVGVLALTKSDASIKVLWLHIIEYLSHFLRFLPTFIGEDMKHHLHCGKIVTILRFGYCLYIQDAHPEAVLLCILLIAKAMKNT